MNLTDSLGQNLPGLTRIVSKENRSSVILYKAGNKIYALFTVKIELGCVSLGKSENGSLIQAHLDQGAPEEPMNPFWEKILRFL